MMNTFGQQVPNGQIYGNQQRPQALMRNPLTPEEREALKKSGGDTFNLKVDKDEIAEAVCTHKDQDTQDFSTVVNPDGSLTCTICGETFSPDMVTPDYVESAVSAILNVLNTCKWLAVDLNDNTIRQYFSMIPYIKKIPKLYKMASATYTAYMSKINPNMQQAQPSYFNALNWIMNPGTVVNPQMMYGNPYQQQMQNGQFYNQQPMYTPYQQQQAAMMNGTGTPFYQQTMQQQATMNNNQGTPVQQQSADQQQNTPVQQPVQPGDVQVKQKLTL